MRWTQRSGNKVSREGKEEGKGKSVKKDEEIAS